MSNREIPMEISCEDVDAKRRAGEEFLLFDCREQDEFDLVKIEGAVHLPMSELMTRVSELEPYREQPIVVHCHHGGRSLQVASWLRGQGFVSVASMAGGIDQWAAGIEPGMTRY